MEGLLAVWNDCLPEFKDRYHLWYETDHIPERIAIEGFLTATRYEAVKPFDGYPGNEFFTCYELTSPSVLASPDYQTLLTAPSKRTQEMMSVFRNMWRSVAKLERQVGCYAGTWLITIRIGNGKERMPGDALNRAKSALYKHLADESFLQNTSACRWRTFQTVVPKVLGEYATRESEFAEPSPEQKFRVASDLIPEFFSLIEFRRETSLRRATENFIAPLVEEVKGFCAISVNALSEIGRTVNR